MNNPLDMLVKVQFTWQHVEMFKGLINRHNRRRYNKLSRLGLLQAKDVPMYFLLHTEQRPFAEPAV